MLRFDQARYWLLAWVVMPSQVHTLIETLEACPLPDLVQSWQSFTAKAANAFLGRTGTFWERDDFDRYVRDDYYQAAVLNDIGQNPVKAGLVARVEDWRWICAARRRASQCRQDAGAPRTVGVRERRPPAGTGTGGGKPEGNRGRTTKS